MRKSAAKKRAVTASLVTQSAQSLTDKAYGQLEEMIVTLRLAPGRAVSESELSRHLGIGRTPIREALQRLAREHLVTILPRRGIIVSAVNPSNQLRLLEVRRELERLIARSAARRCSDAERGRFRELAKLFETSARTDDEVTFMRVDREFNELCSRTAHNEFAASTMLLLHSLSRRFWFIHYRQVADMPLAGRLHAGMARAIAAGNEAAAAAASDKLLDYIEEFTRATVSAER